MSPHIRGWVAALVPCTLAVALFSAGPVRAADILFVVDDNSGALGTPDKGSDDVGSDTNAGPNSHPTLGLQQRMEALGHTVTILDERADTASTLAAAAGKQLVVISSSVGSGNITFDKFGGLTQPIINMEPASYDNLRMSGADSVVDLTVTSINIVNPNSPLAGGFPAGVRSVGDQVNLLPAATVAPGAIIVAESGNAGDNRIAIFDIPQDAMLFDGTPAAGRRIAFFWNANGINYNADAQTFFDTAVRDALVPEPAGACLLAGTGLLALQRRRRRV
jgi:hypothetical protein